MAYSTQRAVSDGSMVLLPISIEYFDREEISVLFDGIVDAREWSWVGAEDHTISFTPAVAVGTEVMVARTTDISNIRHEYNNGAQFTADSIDESFRQLLHGVQEASEGASLVEVFRDLDFHGYKALNVGDATGPMDAVNLRQMVEYQISTAERLPEVGNYAVLRDYTGQVTAVLVRGVSNIFDGGHGVFRVDSTDTSSADNGITLLVDAIGRRWKREFNGPVLADWAEGADKTGVTSSTAAIAKAIAVVSSGGGEVRLSRGTYKANVAIPSGVILTGESAANIFSANPKGTKLVADNLTNPVVSISKSPTAIVGAVLRNVCIDAVGAQTGLYIAGASYVKVESVSVINGANTNILIECVANGPTYFVHLNQVTTYNAANYNFKVLENPNAGGVTFTTGIYCNGMISYTQPGKTTEGRIAYIQGQVIVNGYWEDSGSNLVVVDKSSSLDTALIGNGLVIDGQTGNNAVKIITSPTWTALRGITLNSYYVPTTANGYYYRCSTAGNTGAVEPTWPTTVGATVADGSVVWTCAVYPYARINGYLTGQISVDGNVINASNGIVTSGPVGSTDADYKVPGIVRGTFDSPAIFGNLSGFQYSFYDHVAKSTRKKASQPTSSTDGNVIVGAEGGFVAAPVSGTWARGDVVFNSSPVRGGVLGWVCTVAGTPGTWEAFGSVGAVENVATLPTPDSTQRGRHVTVLGGAGTADKLYICLRSAATTYSWVQVATGG